MKCKFNKILLSSTLFLLFSCEMKPSETISVDIDKTQNGSLEQSKSIEQSLQDKTLIDNYQNKPYLLIEYALKKQASYPYSLSMMKGVAKSSTLGIKVNQEIQSCNYYTPDENFNQNISSSNFVKTADRFYDKKDGYILAYNGKKSSDWKKMELSKKYTYDEYIQKYGKLIKSDYYCYQTNLENAVIQEAYLTDQEAEYQASTISKKYEVNAVSMLAFTSSSILSSRLNKIDSGYELYLKLDPNKANVYSKIQMKSTGGLSDYPQFTSSEITYYLDDDFSILSAISVDEYHAKMSAISTNIRMESNFTYLHSYTSTFQKDDKEIQVLIPSMQDENFNGYEFLN